MKRLVLTLVLVASPAAADVAELDRSVEAARAEGKYAFCTDPPKPLLHRQRSLCSLAETVPDCAALREACQTTPKKKETASWIRALAAWIAPVAKVVLYLLVLAIALVVAVPLIRALLRRRRTERVKPLADRTNIAALLPDARTAEGSNDPEATLAEADAERRRGDDRRALGLYLAASLAALDRRGVLRLGRHRTNGEYVRACRDEAARPDLRAIVSQVDRVDFGGEAPTEESLTDVAGRARGLVRAAIVTGVALLLLVGCGGGKRGSDPAGDELPTDVLVRNGFHVGPLTTSLATMPIESAADAPVAVVDLERVPIEEEARIHLERWVEAGGTLVLFGRPELWPERLAAHGMAASARTVSVELPREDEDEAVEATLARPDAVAWPSARALARVGDELYAGKKRLGKGLVLGVANDDLMTNLGVLPAHNGAALVTLLRAIAHDSRRTTHALDEIRIARAEDGIPPPSNPFTALAAAGLGKGAWHALAAAIVLFLAFGIRHARPRPVRATVRRAFAEHVQATGALYARTDAKVHALRAYGKFVELRLREVPADVEKLLARAREDNAEPRGDELAVLEELRSAVAPRLRRRQ